MSLGPAIVLFALAALVSMRVSWLLVSRLERLGARFGMTEALLGMLAALAADAPEITASVTALAGHQSRIGAGVVVGSNVFNLAALLGLGAVVARRIEFHRRVVALEGAVALWIAAVCLLAVIGVVGAVVGLLLAFGVLVPYVSVLGVPRDRLRRFVMQASWRRWLIEAISESEVELEVAFHPRRGRRRDVVEALLATLIVVGASIGMEQAGARIGTRLGWPGIITGGLLLAAVTSIPNAVAAVYLALRGRGAATLSTAMNSNALNVTLGLLLPGAIAGLGAGSGSAAFVAATYAGMTLLVLALARHHGGLHRRDGVLVIGIYVSFGIVLAAIA